MKLRNIFISGLGVLALTSCNDFLEVDAPSKFTPELIYSSEKEINTALNGVYAKILVNNLYGNALYNDLMLNSDVDFHPDGSETANENDPRRFDVRPRGSKAENLWNACYSGIESANEFIYGLENSELYSQKFEEETSVDDNGEVTVTQVPQTTDMTQKMGEAKVIRAMLYHELLAYYGDVPFTTEPTSVTNEFLPDVKNRTEISKALIDDLIAISDYMYSDANQNSSDAPERIYKEACWAMIARLALQAGGYSLNHVDEDGNELGTETYGVMTRPENWEEFYEIARDYAGKVIDGGSHSLDGTYKNVFISECNFIPLKGNDPIFEIPFGRGETGNWGYYQGPEVKSNSGETVHKYGECKGSVQTTAFYRYEFEEGDTRRDLVDGMWYYSETGLPVIHFDYGMYNNKWSKLWNTNGLGKETTGSTGINFPYIRYADVLLMYAEADVKLTKVVGTKARKYVQQVRDRAYRKDKGTQVSAPTISTNDPAVFFDEILQERMREFAGENMRWKDLVRNNLYAEKVYYTFLTYYSVGAEGAGWADYYEQVDEYRGKPYDLPRNVYSFYVKNPADGEYPNEELSKLYIFNPYKNSSYDPSATAPNSFITAGGREDMGGMPVKDIYGNKLTALTVADITDNENDSQKYTWTKTATYSNQFGNDNGVNAKVLYSFYGYIRGGEREGTIEIVNNGIVERIDPSQYDTKNLPTLRYLLPYPQEIITRSAGKYKQYYGFK